MTKEFVSWYDVTNFVCEVADLYTEKKPVGVFGLPRGGLVPAVMLSHKLDIPLLGAPCKGCLVVDDIADSGESLIHYARMNYDIVTVVSNKDCPITPLYSYRKREADWVVFPWEYSRRPSDPIGDLFGDAEIYYNSFKEAYELRIPEHLQAKKDS